MPNYEYQCECGKAFEKIMPMSERHNAKCSCGATPQLKISGAGFRIAEPFTVCSQDGTILKQTQTIDKLPPVGYDTSRDNVREV